MLSQNSTFGGIWKILKLIFLITTFVFQKLVENRGRDQKQNIFLHKWISQSNGVTRIKSDSKDASYGYFLDVSPLLCTPTCPPFSPLFHPSLAHIDTAPALLNQEWMVDIFLLYLADCIVSATIYCVYFIIFDQLNLV